MSRAQPAAPETMDASMSTPSAGCTSTGQALKNRSASTVDSFLVLTCSTTPATRKAPAASTKKKSNTRKLFSALSHSGGGASSGAAVPAAASAAFSAARFARSLRRHACSAALSVALSAAAWSAGPYSALQGASRAA